jgi:tRNA threonylcarbamoyl adenosine modification protein (Sua5/YciO/YrdC/YwlC family)
MNTRVFKARVDDRGRLHFPERDEAAACLARGGIVAFPTETVYGLGANMAIPSALDRLCALKQRPPDKPFSLHVASREDLYRYVKAVPGRAVRLMHRFWPGPVTLVLPTNDGKALGVRFPANQVAVELIRLAGVPVVAPSANVSGEEPACDAAQVMGTFMGKVDVIIDGGTTELKQSSTVVSFAGDGPEVLREGIVTRDMVERTVRTRVLFVCGGNSCRSPMAESIARRVLADMYEVEESGLAGFGFEISSAGTAAMDGGMPTDHGIAALKNLGYNPPRGSTTRLRSEMVEDADYVFTMTEAQKYRVIEMAPMCRARVELLDPEGKDIEDPIGSSVAEYEECARRIRSGLDMRMEQI